MQPFLVSAGLVALAEFGDKTQMLALVLAARFRRPLPILLGILLATLANHALAAAAGTWVAATLGPRLLRSILGLAFIAMALWTLKADRLDAWPGTPEREAGPAPSVESAGSDALAQSSSSDRTGKPGWLRVFAISLTGFFLLEMGDKTQIATVTLAARYHALLPVLAGSTIGMLSADAIAILLGEAAARKLPLRLLRATAAGIFFLIGVLVLLGARA